MLSTIDEIKVDHNNIKDLYMRYKAEKDYNAKSTLVNTIIREIAVHSEAEEVTVYNSLEKFSEADAKHLRDEHQELEEQLYSLDYTKIDAPEFAPKFDQAMKLFCIHSAEEEQAGSASLAALLEKLSPEDDDALAKKFLAMRKGVPTRPHPAAPQDGGMLHKIAGMATKPHDKIMELLTGRTFADLKYVHPATEKPVQSLELPQQYLSA